MVGNKTIVSGRQCMQHQTWLIWHALKIVVEASIASINGIMVVEIPLMVPFYNKTFPPKYNDITHIPKPHIISPLYQTNQTLKLLLTAYDQTMKGGKSSGAVKKPDGKLAVKKTAANAKAAKDPNKPKRPASAFFVFMEEFRKQFKEENPDNKSVAAVGKAGGVKWKSMSVAEKAPYVAKAEKRKTEYEKNMTAYNKKQAAGGDDEDDDSDKSKSEINNEDEDSDDEEDDD
ncbi:hypothetical protein L1987_10713 [Smallanthus sonchifolius]|uniref:Uncharacterized protein n=1 Tax=Smallanthus sonchifolius TaxID=185202 RepID=A0ACB9JAE8_9ASTR|nr:hypothetical protein L1987_10713 [Smallanthus sonchifolius]